MTERSRFQAPKSNSKSLFFRFFVGAIPPRSRSLWCQPTWWCLCQRSTVARIGTSFVNFDLAYSLIDIKRFAAGCSLTHLFEYFVPVGGIEASSPTIRKSANAPMHFLIKLVEKNSK